MAPLNPYPRTRVETATAPAPEGAQRFAKMPARLITAFIVFAHLILALAIVVIGILGRHTR